MTTRYTFGGDEHLFVEMDESMSLQAFFRAFGLCNAVRDSRIVGVTEVCPANASLLIRFDPDLIKPSDLLKEVQAIETAGPTIETLTTRILELPVYYDDPWTRETLMRFRDRHQDPAATDLEYAARINNYASVADLVAAHSGSPWFVSMVGFVAGCPWMFQMVEQDKQIQVPKYVRPRTDTPKQCIGYGGCFTAIYPVRGAGGYQMFGITPLPIYDPTQTISYLRDDMILFRPGDIVKYRPIGREEYDAIVADISQNSFVPSAQTLSFSLADFNRAPASYSHRIVETLNGG